MIEAVHEVTSCVLEVITFASQLPETRADLITYVVVDPMQCNGWEGFLYLSVSSHFMLEDERTSLSLMDGALVRL